MTTKTKSISSAEITQNVSSTRVCIKNLPPRFTEMQLKQFILENVICSDGKPVRVNDVRILMRNGKSRKVAFVGFSDVDKASLCISRLNATYCGMAKISVEAALAKVHKINTTEEAGTSSNRNEALGEVGSGIGLDDKDNAMEKKKQEFLDAMAPRHSKKFWENDDATGAREKKAQNANEDSSDTSEESSDDSTAYSTDSHSLNIEKEEPQSGEIEDEKKFSNNRLFLRNLPYNATEEDIRNLFSGFGKINEVHIPVDDRHQNKGFAFLEFSNKTCCEVARETCDGTDFMGRLLHVLPARERPADEGIEVRIC